MQLIKEEENTVETLSSKVISFRQFQTLATCWNRLANTTPAQIRLVVQASRASWFPPPRGDVQSANLDKNAGRL